MPSSLELLARLWGYAPSRLSSQHGFGVVPRSLELSVRFGGKPQSLELSSRFGGYALVT